MNQVMNVYVSTTVYAYLNITPQRDSGLYLKQDVSVRENPVEIVVVIKKINKERNNNKKKKAHKTSRGCYDNNHLAKY